jgi:hypothetical protein
MVANVRDEHKKRKKKIRVNAIAHLSSGVKSSVSVPHMGARTSQEMTIEEGYTYDEISNLIMLGWVFRLELHRVTAS